MDQFENEVETAPTVLAQAAERFGVERKFQDIWAKEHEASDEVLTAVLRSLGVPADNDEQLAEAVRLSAAADWIRPIADTVVTGQTGSTFTLSVPKRLADSTVRVAIDFEDGSFGERDFALKGARVESEASVDGPEYIREQVEFARTMPMGYHRLTITIAGQIQASARLIVAPEKAYQPEWLVQGKAAGVAVSLYGVRSGHNWGCGDCGDLSALVDWIVALGGDFLALNPLHHIPNRQPYNTSPYLPNSSFYRNHIYLDLELIDDYAAYAQGLRASSAVQSEIAELRAAPLVEYERISRLKMRVLKLLFRRFLATDYLPRTVRGMAFREFVDHEGALLHLFAVHAVLDETMHKANKDVWNWPGWPNEYQNPDSPETASFAEKHWRSVLLHKYIQWQLHLQFERAQAYALSRGLRIGLYHDLALATDRFGSDLWAHRPFYAQGCRVGSPPDHFSPKGQDWAFPPPNSLRHFKDGYQLFAESIRKASAHGGALRIDHVMRFFRLYWIPDGKDATEGTYVRDRYEDLIRVLALESVRGKFVVIGEDLGTVPGYVRETLHKFGILSYRLFYFEQDPSGRFFRPDEYPRQALVSPTTHDLPTLAGFWQGADIEARRAAGVLVGEEAFRSSIQERAVEKQKMLNLLHDLRLLPDWYPRDVRYSPELTGELHNAIIGFLALTPSQLLVVNQEDLYKDPDQQNLPGTTEEQPNWRHKMKFTVEELSSDRTRGYNLMFRSWLNRTGRMNQRK